MLVTKLIEHHVKDLVKADSLVKISVLQDESYQALPKWMAAMTDPNLGTKSPKSRMVRQISQLRPVLSGQLMVITCGSPAFCPFCISTASSSLVTRMFKLTGDETLQKCPASNRRARRVDGRHGGGFTAGKFFFFGFEWRTSCCFHRNLERWFGIESEDSTDTFLSAFLAKIHVSKPVGFSYGHVA
ncbi:hypothetical protein U1Q18_042870 [Sarracenia purpurea var. burkii]